MYDYDICVVGGLGHVGFPLGLAFANAGKRVVLYDIDQNKIDMLASGTIPFKEEGAQQILNQVYGKNLYATPDIESISKSRFVIIIIGTPVDEYLNPKYTSFINFFNGIIDYLKDGQHVILRSTVYPQTTEKVYKFLKESGKNVRVSYCPERIAQGIALKEFRTLPQIVSSFDDDALDEVKSLFLAIADEVVPLSPLEAELAKLFTNTWRYISFATSNQFYQIAEQNGVDFYKIHHAVTYNYPRLKGFAGAGLTAGPCLHKDTMQLAAFSNNSFFLGHAAMLINEGLPNFIVQTIKQRNKMNDKTIGILGMTFKGDIDDNRDSLSYKLKKICSIEAKSVVCSDPYLDDPEFISQSDLIDRSDIIIIAAPHRRYAQADLPPCKIVVDIWNMFGKGTYFTTT
ncbi:MAG: nucleotide sugar dehydrogenase [Candidatus Auribacterota bacterium]|jgi:UDP-N-acetyl-D-mannosaminuronic acid dehydrogenase|nr:nucleotide sugar dehydrogenase [Candidatus Auribacterota bacterium]